MAIRMTVLARLQGVASLEENCKMHWTEKSEKPTLLLAKSEKQRLVNWRKPANRARHHNRKTTVFKCEMVEKSHQKLAKSSKPKISTPPLSIKQV